MPEHDEAPIIITINGQAVEARKGAMLVDAAKAVGVEIPVFCYEPRLGKPIGACRMCLVEVEGMRGLQTACSTPVAADMVVNTTSDQVKDAQDGVLELLLANHPLDCPVCDKGGECPLQDRTFQFGPGETRILEPKNHFPKPLDLSPLVALDRERCIACFRCVRFSQEVAEDAQLTFHERGDSTEIATFSGEPYEGRFTGNTIDLCPVGALTSNPYRFVSRPWDIKNAPSICAGCAVGCNLEITERDGEIKRVTGRPDPNMAVEEGWICDRGRWAFPALTAGDRLLMPEIVDQVGRRHVRIERAVGDAGAILRRTGIRVAFLLGTPVTVEDGFLALELSHLLGDGPVARLGVADDGLGPLRALPGAQMHDMDGADVIVVVGGDPSSQQPVTELRLRKARRNGARVAMVGPRPTALDGNTAEALRTVPGRLGDAIDVVAERLLGSSRAIVLWDECDLAAEPDTADALARLVASTPGARAIELAADVSGPGLRALGIPATGVLEQIEAGEVDVLITVKADPTTGPGGTRWAAALDQVPTVIALSTHRSPIVDRAAIAIPVLYGLEEAGTLVSMAGRAQRLRPGAIGPEGAAAAWEVLVGLSHRMGQPLPDRTAAQAFDRMAKRFPAFAGLTCTDLGLLGVPIAAGTGGPAAPARRAEGEGLPLVVSNPVFGDATAHRSDALDCVREETHLGLSPAEAGRLGVSGSTHVRVTTPFASVLLPLVEDHRLHEAGAYLVLGDPTSMAATLLPADRGPVCAVITAPVAQGVGA
ncbi:MAG: 2Fe-2S iron-sulfur cluster-binding protein [Miltoncostaeaceae bacterium]